MVQIAIVVTNKLYAAAISFKTCDILIDLNELCYSIEPNVSNLLMVQNCMSAEMIPFIYYIYIYTYFYKILISGTALVVCAFK